ncbi:MAG: hypothetical protein CMH54_14115 [Myxococcales bacterium]|nr:hypothetical protein [Myxococcales bacterium]|tara:strand:+ start:508 stop:1170 length:663 start_codon:yes stop_codon:yes gene_type:complete
MEETGISGEAQVISEVDGSLRKGRIFFAVRPEDSLLVEAVTPSDDTIAILAMHKDRFMTYERGEATCRVGPPCRANVMRVLPVYMNGAEVVQMFFGRPPLIDGDLNPLVLDSKTRRRVLELTRTDGIRQRLEFSASRRRLFRSQIWSGDTLISEIRYDRFRRGPKGQELPGRVQIRRPDIKAHITIRLLEVDALQENPRTFSTDCPGGTKAVEQPCEIAP